MNDIYLFDWGDTLMVDTPGMSGKMCNWDAVEVVDGAYHTLEQLAQSASIYIATSAADSEPKDIEAAFARVGLSQFISGYFCFSNIGAKKGEPEFLQRILRCLDVSNELIVVVGDTLEKDIIPAVNIGVNAVLYNPKLAKPSNTIGVKEIGCLTELIPLRGL